MKIKISYFNNIRHFNKYDIPLSTAMWDPKWFTNHIDKNGVINGLKCKPFIFDWERWSKLCMEGEQCEKECKFKHGECKFEKEYYEQLKEINFEKLMNWFQAVQYKCAELNDDLDNKDKYKIVLIVHEKPERYCAERPVLFQYFKDNNYILEEYSL